MGIGCYLGVKQRPQHLCRCFREAGWHVLYVNPEKLQGISEYDGVRVDSLDKSPFVGLGRRKFYTEAFWKRIQRWVGKDPGRIVLWVNGPFWFPFVDAIKKYYGNLVEIVYDILDDLEQFPNYAQYWKVLGPLHELLIETADYVVCSSEYLTEKIPGSILVKNACWFEDWDIPLIKENPPIIGYAGAFSYWFDSDLAIRIIRAGFRLELVGPLFLGSLSEELLPFYHKEVAYEKLGTVVQRWSCGLILHKVCKLTDAADCLKTYEYQALGLPVVAPPTLSSIRQQKDGAKITLVSPDFFPLIIGREIELDTLELVGQRKDWAKRNTWEIRYHQIEGMLS